MKILILTLNHKGVMIQYTNQLIESLSRCSQIVFISGNIEYVFSKNVYKVKVSLKNRDLLTTILTIKTIIQKENPDVVHITSAHWYYLFLCFVIKKKPLVITLHDVEPHIGEKNIFVQYLKKKLIADADHIFVHGKILKDQLIFSGVSHRKISVIPHGDYSLILNYSGPKLPEEDVVLSFGRIIEYKELNYLLNPMIDLPKIPRIKLVIAGSGDLSPYLQKISQLEPELVEIDNFFIPASHVRNFFERAKIIVLPYVEAYQTGIIPIAYAFKKPVIATSVGAILEIVGDGKTGILVRPRDSAALGSAIIDLVNDENKRKIIAENGYLKMKNELSLEKIVKNNGKNLSESNCSKVE